MTRKAKAVGFAMLLGATATISNANAQEFTLSPVIVKDNAIHSSQKVRNSVNESYNSSRSSSSVGGTVLQNLNPTNIGDALRYNATGLISTPFDGDRFGGGTKIRTFGDWGASQSIDGRPSFELQGGEGGGFTNTIIPSIAVDSVDVLKGGRAVQYGNNTDGGVVQTNIKSGRNYKDHQAISIEGSTAREGLVQAEAADHGDTWDYYTAIRTFHGNYKGEPSNLDSQVVNGGVGKFGWNISDDTRAEFLAILSDSQPDVYRNNVITEPTAKAFVGALTLDHKLSDTRSVEVGLQNVESNSTWPARSRYRGLDNQTLYANHYTTTKLSDTIDYDGSVGAEYKRTLYTRDNQWKNTFDDYALSSTNSFTFDDNLMLTGGARYTFFNNEIILNGVEQADNLQTDGVLSVQLGASYNVLEKTRVRTSFANGYNRFFSKYGNFGTDALDSTGAQDEIVQSRTIEAGINQKIGKGYFDLAVYNILQDNVPRRNGGAIENMEVDQSGLEFELLQQITDRLTASAGYMHIFELEATRADGTKVNSNIFWDGQTAPMPENQVSLRLDYDLMDDVGLWGAAYYTTGYDSVAADGTVTERDGFTRLDVGANWQALDKLGLRFRVENVLDERDFGQTVKGLPVNDDDKLGRVFWLALDYTF